MIHGAARTHVCYPTKYKMLETPPRVASNVNNIRRVRFQRQSCPGVLVLKRVRAVRNMSVPLIPQQFVTC